MPYDEKFRKTILDTFNILQHDGHLFRRRKHTLEMILTEYIKKMHSKYTSLGSNILQRLQEHIINIFKNINPNSNYETLEYINNVIKWYFKSLTIHRNKTSKEVIIVSLPDYTIPEIKELHDNMIIPLN
jgi:hypothetical protein